VPISLLWPFVALVVGQEWSTALTFVLPVVALSVLRRWELSRRNRWAAPPPPVDADAIEAPAA
ncbi:MAG TPA: hypothetical protein VF310_10520, partial [Vicinamibacteria bacterium]